MVGDFLFVCVKLVIGCNKGSSVVVLFMVVVGLDGSFNVVNVFYGDVVLVVMVDVLVFEFINFVEKDIEFVGDVRDIFVFVFFLDG